MAAVQFKYALLVILATVFSQTSCDAIITEEVLYEEDAAGNVLVDLFDATPPMSNLAPVLGTYNPSVRLESCDVLGEGAHPVFGNCSRYLHCNKTDEGYHRRIIECTIGLWYRQDLGRCGIRNSEACPYGRLVPNPPTSSSNDPAPLRTFSSVSNDGTCTESGQFAMPGCRGYYSCVPSASGFYKYTYQCAEGTRWDQNPPNDFCIPENQVVCNIPEEGTECLRECRAGETRTCRYTFIVEEYATMSIYCKKCPFIPSDCDLPNCIPAGGVSKPVVSINRRVPGPVIQACKGDTLEIEVQNRLPSKSVSIHWHGLHQRATPQMDGVPYVTQCPIPPNSVFRYRMEADISGTHMYHSHIGHQETDGLFGAMIIREPRSAEYGISSRYDEDLPDHRMLIWHWFARSADVESLDTRMQSLRREGYGYTINGKGVVKKIYNPDSGTTTATPVENYQVTTNKRYRFRSIFNSALNCPVQISIDGHQLDIIATDGRPVRSQSSLVDSFFLSAGERVDFVPIPRYNVNTYGRSYYIRVRGLMDCDDAKKGVHQYAILRYDGSAATPEGYPSYTNAIRSGPAFNLNQDLFNSNNYYIQARNIRSARDANLVTDTAISQTPQKTYYIDVRFNMVMESENIRVVYPQLNNMTWQSPSFPVLTQGENITASTFCRPGAPRNCNNGVCRCAQVLEPDLGDLVEVVLVDSAGLGVGHPFHLHGYAFRVVAMGTQSTTVTSIAEVRALNERGGIPKTYDGPLKDTVIVPTRSYVIFRFVANNPGYWLFHCHISEHMSQGMALLFKVGLEAHMVKPPSNFPKCGNHM